MISSVKGSITVFSIGCLLFGFFAGTVFQKFYGVGRIIGIVQKPKVVEAAHANTNTDNREEVPFEALQSKPRVMVALVFGQSNSANFGETRKSANHGVYNFYKGKLYKAQDPLLGAGGNGGSVWTRLGDKLIERKLYDAVVFVPIGVGATAITRWRSTGDLHSSLISAIEEVRRHGLSITHLFWHQGEADALYKTPKTAYKEMFLDMLSSIRRHGVQAPVYVPIATRCKRQRESKEIQEAQIELVNIPAGIFPGPDTDSLGLSYRYDGCHFSDEGLEKEATMWLSALESNTGYFMRKMSSSLSKD